ncbi:hypothetical protein [Paludisphaera rhizosphaerae]|uniref:hypothetical protein n=1 Tax=Paludisphaera rhizosphaerae TaxID=2711216 RepID=UPI0013EA8A70|nr:hypothetical protein [Paludisphaera rhizosphaerae]
MQKVMGFMLAASLGLAEATRASEPTTVGDVVPAAGGGVAYTVERGWKEVGGGRVLFEHYRDRGGRVVASLEATYAGGRLAGVRYEQAQTGESAAVEFKEGKAFYAANQGGKTKRSSENDSGVMVAYNAVPEHIAARWDELQAGRAVKFDVPVPVMRQSFTFKVTKERTWSQGGRTLAEFKMESPNPIVRALSEPSYYVIDDCSKALVEYRGLTLATSGTPGDAKQLDAKVTYRPTAGR